MVGEGVPSRSKAWPTQVKTQLLPPGLQSTCPVLHWPQMHSCAVFLPDPPTPYETHFAPSVSAGPHFVAVNNKNEIVVTDFHNHSVKVRRPPESLPWGSII